MKIKSLTSIIVIGIILAVTSLFTNLSALDAPHNESNTMSCGDCHGQTLLNSPFWTNSEDYDIICTSCHYLDGRGPYAETHVDRQCRDCHNPHYQRQIGYKNTDAGNLYLASGKITSCEYKDPVPPAVVGTSTLTYSTITYKSSPVWDAASLIDKTAKGGNNKRSAILFPNVARLGYNYPVTAVDTPDENTITVKGDACTTLNLTIPPTFAVIYGQYIKDVIDISGDRSGINRTVKFSDRKGINSYADGDTTYNGVCEVCHTQTKYHKNDGTGEPHYPAVRCSICHNHVDGFASSDHTGGSGADCEGCHGKDADHGGFGTTISHSTHMENDADDLKGPHITCDVCHDTDNYPYFKSGTDSNSDGKYDLSETDVCDNCHSPGGSYNGVNSVSGSVGAKDNWTNGVYTGTALAIGKEKWCAGCHDETPAYSKGQHFEIIIDNTDTNFSTSGTGWNTSTSTQQYGTNFRYHTAGTGTNTATWTLNIPQAGEYSVYAWWVDYTNRATNAPYTINYAGGSETVNVNQKINGGTWNYLGTYSFAAGTSGSVVLSDNANGTIVADAIKIESGGQATYAPNVLGDNVTYGFYITGHKINCLSCHDSSKKHIDGDPRTYEADEATSTAINPYCESYRLRYINGQCSTNLPRASASSSPQTDWQDFALCFECHNRYEVLGQTSSDVSHTNFWNNDSSISNSHWIHLSINSKHFDSDWDGTEDSRESCITCHNVHGSPTGAMIRHGELISPPGTIRYVPSLNFYYLITGDGSATATFTPALAGGTYDIYTWWSASQNRATNAKYLINHDGGQAEVIVNQEINGGQWNLLGEYTITTSSGSVILTSQGANEYIMADAIRWYRTDNGDEVIVDDPDATYTPNIDAWTEDTTNPDIWGTSQRYYYAPIRDANATLTDSFGGTFYCSGILGNNHVCVMCHSYVVYNRNPYKGPRIPSANANPSQVTNNQITTVLFTAYVTDPDNNVSTVVVDLSPVGGGINVDMYDDGSHGDVTPGDGTYSIQYNVPSGIDEGPKSLRVTATDAESLTGEAFISLTVNELGAFVIDNPDATFVDTWPVSTGGAGMYGLNYQYHVGGGTGANTATWSFSIGTAGNYEIYAWWVASTNRATNAPYTINYQGGSQTVRVSQRIKGGQWNYLGKYSFGVGTYSVVLSDDANNYVIADAIKVSPEGTPHYYPFPISDNPDAEYVGEWMATTNVDDYGDDFYYHAIGTGTNSATWTLAVPEAGNYNVYAWWAEGSNRAADTKYTINYEGGSDTITVCQQVRGGRWNYLGNYPFNVGNYSVVMTDNATSGTYVIADAIKFELGSPPDAPYSIADNWDATFIGPWTGSTGQNEYGPDFQYHAAGTGSNTVTWTIKVPSAGDYSIYAWWTDNTNRATNAPYTINYEGGSDTVYVSQRIKGGEWNYLGTYTFNAGDYTVGLSDNANGLVVADAIKFEPGSYTPGSSWPIADNLDADVIGPWQSSTSGTQYFDTDFYYIPASGGGTGTNTTTWTLAVPSAGNYNVYAWWTEYWSPTDVPNRAADAPYTINYEGGADIVRVSQQIKGGQWNYLGNYNFGVGIYTVILSDDITFLTTGNTLVADAIKFELGSAPPNPYPIADNWNASFVGPWQASHWTGAGLYYGPDYQYFPHGDGTQIATWTSDIPEAGTYSVYARWTSETVYRASDAPYTIYYDGGSNLVTADQRYNGGKWMYMGSYPFNIDSYSVELRSRINKYVIADAIKWEKGLVVDNVNSTFSGTWTEATDTTDRFSTSYRYHVSGSGNDTATWTPDIPAGGDYAVYAWWCANTDRATNAPYTINYNGGSAIVNINQQQNGGKWNLLGTYPFVSGTSGYVELGESTTGKVIADAIRWVHLVGDASKGSQLVDHIPPDYSTTGMTFTAELYDTDSISSVQVVGYSSGSCDWVYEDMTNTEGNTWTKVLGANDWVKSNGYYFKVTDTSSKITFIGCGGEQYSVEGGYGSDALAETAVRSDTYQYGGGTCPP